MIIPHSALSSETLRNLIESFVIEGASDEGHVDMALEDKVALVMAGLVNSDYFIVFDEASETCTIVDKDTARQMTQ